ncbi:hypothetical protein DIPPA_34094 [Diplonema papillatum]|nr:hypothetical protein DIPPA_34094 [Diplonema papillatum]
MFTLALGAEGATCDYPDCGGHGGCFAGLCYCEDGWFGTSCGMTFEACNRDVCQARGVCLGSARSRGRVLCECPLGVQHLPGGHPLPVPVSIRPRRPSGESDAGAAA